MRVGRDCQQLRLVHQIAHPDRVHRCTATSQQPGGGWQKRLVDGRTAPRDEDDQVWDVGSTANAGAEGRLRYLKCGGKVDGIVAGEW